MDIDKLMAGAWDLHAHGSPEFSPQAPGAIDNLGWARQAAAAGMEGFVIKSHVFPTVAEARLLSALVPEVEVLGSIALNPTSGGVDATAVELALELGARLVWMPTWSARGSAHSGVLNRMAPYISSLDAGHWPAHGLAVVDEQGRLTRAAEDVLRVCVERGVAVASGHLPAAASVRVCERVADLGGRFVLTHPLSTSVAAGAAEQAAIVEMGGYVEHVFLGCLPLHGQMDPRRIVDAIGEVGAEHCVLSTDAIYGWNPAPPQMLRMFLATLAGLGVGEEDLRVMTHQNPRAVLGLR